MPLVPLTRTEATCPPPPSMVMALVMVTAPYPAGSSASISPPAAVLGIAPANVLHGAVRLQGLASSPTPETHVRVACAPARDAPPTTVASTPIAHAHRIALIIRPLPSRRRSVRVRVDYGVEELRVNDVLRNRLS